jgi:pimeloyl-ACP methyl ester carboxylesterase
MATRKHAAPEAPSRNANDLRGLGRLAIDGVTGMTDLVEAMHAAITHLPSAIGRPAPASTTGITGFTYQSVRTVTGWVGDGIDASLTSLGPLLGSGGQGQQRDAILAAMNGVLGDHLEGSRNPLAITMQLRADGEALALDRKFLATRFPDAGGKLLVLVHGLCMDDLQWNYAGHDHGEALAREFGYTALYLNYNSGRHISTNGRDFSSLLDQVAKAWPVPVEEITLLGHSMGGLVARSAIDDAFSQGRMWSKFPIHAIFLGTPHHGAPLERAGSWADMLIGISPYSAPFVRLGQMRSAGIQDLRHGNLRDADWQDRDGDGRADPRTPLPLPKPVTAYAIAVSTQAKRKDAGASRGSGDGLVPIDSALGIHPDKRFDLRIPKPRQWIGYGINHLELLGNDEVYQQLRRWLRTPLRRD